MRLAKECRGNGSADACGAMALNRTALSEPPPSTPWSCQVFATFFAPLRSFLCSSRYAHLKVSLQYVCGPQLKRATVRRPTKPAWQISNHCSNAGADAAQQLAI